MGDNVIENLKNIIIRNRLTPERASQLCGLDRSYFRKLFDRSVGSPRGPTLEKIATGLGVTIEEILHGAPAISPAGQALNFETFINSPQAFPNDIPILGTAAGSHLKGAFQLSTDPIGYARRPPGLIGAIGIYGLYVEGESMIPQYQHGQLLLINPNKPVSIGDGVIVQTRNGEHSQTESTLGVLQRRTADAITILKHNPKADIDFKSAYVLSIHKVLTTNELLGI